MKYAHFYYPVTRKLPFPPPDGKAAGTAVLCSRRLYLFSFSKKAAQCLTCLLIVPVPQVF